jgi:hypothetical protein
VSDVNGGTSFCDPCRGKVAVLQGLQFVPCRPLPAPLLKAVPEVSRRRDRRAPPRRSAPAAAP